VVAISHPKHYFEELRVYPSSCGGISGRRFTEALDDDARPTEMGTGAAASNFFGDFSDRCRCMGKTILGLRDLVWLISSSSRDAGGCGDAGLDL
jgi:hypothetical protein